MNGDAAVEQVGGAPSQLAVETVKPEKPKRNCRPRPQPRAAVAPPAPKELTFDERVAETKRAARRLAQEKRTKIPFRAGLSLELHELLVAIAQKLGSTGVSEVGLRAMEVGAEQWARSIKVRVDDNVRPLTTFERTPAASNIRDYGVDEERLRAELAEEAQRRSQEHGTEAERLHIPGRRKPA